MANYTKGVAAADALNVSTIYGLIEKVAKQTIDNAYANDDILGDFDKGNFDNGVALEQAIVKQATAYDYSQSAAAFIASNPSLVVKYFNTWNDKQYGVKVYDMDTRAVLKGEKTVSDIAEKCVSSLVEGEKADRYDNMLGTFAYARTENMLTSIGTATTSAALVKLIRDAVWALKFNNTSYYGAGVTLKGRTPLERIRIVIPYAQYNLIDLEVLANIFNLEKADLMAKIIITDATDGMVYVCDAEAFGKVTRLHEITTEYSATQLANYYYLTVSDMYYYSPLFKATYIDASAVV